MGTKAKEVVAQINAPESSTILAIIEKMAIDPNTNVANMERVLGMAERMADRDTEAAFNRAMVKAQTEMGPVSANATNSHTKSKYASYHQLDRALRPIYTKHGFALSFDTGPDAPEKCVRVLCYVSHQDGHKRTHQVDMPADGKGAKGGDVMTQTHAVASGMTYGMRYLLKFVFNVAIGENDDDGNAASARPTISESQLADLNALIEEVQADKKAFLRYLKIDDLTQVPEKSYKTCIAALEAKRKR